MFDNSTYAAAPFDHAKADIILRSSDNIDFRVFKLFLSLPSSFFETLFDIPQPVEENGDQEIKDGLVVVAVTEDIKTFDALRSSYPYTLAEDPNLEVLKNAMDVLEAARKYSLNVIEKKARQANRQPENPRGGASAMLCDRSSRTLAGEDASRRKIHVDAAAHPSWFQEIELLTAIDLLSLLTYHKKCGDAVYALSLDPSWITSHYGSLQVSKTKYANLKLRGIRCLTPMVGRLHAGNIYDTAGQACKETMRAAAEKTAQTIKAGNCQVCSPKITDGMRDFIDEENRGDSFSDRARVKLYKLGSFGALQEDVPMGM